MTALLDRRISVAPMMGYTDRHCRFLLRLLSPSALLYTEMLTARALLQGDTQRLLAFDAREQPVALQLGGSEPTELAAAAALGESYGYREINLNCGCPSDRVQNGQFGACLMSTPERVRDCVLAMRERVSVPVTVKCRIGIEPGMGDRSIDDFLQHFVATVAQAGCKVFIVHARIAVLAGLSPKENRVIPPLQYEVVRRIQHLWPQHTFILNGGVQSVAETLEHLTHFAGVMIGREVYQNPYLLALLHQQLCAPDAALPQREAVTQAYVEYLQLRVAAGDQLGFMLRPILGLYAGLPGARAWRRYLGDTRNHNLNAAVLLGHALRSVGSVV